MNKINYRLQQKTVKLLGCVESQNLLLIWKNYFRWSMQNKNKNINLEYALTTRLYCCNHMNLVTV